MSDKPKEINRQALKNLKPLVAGTPRAKEISSMGAEATRAKFAAQRELKDQLKVISDIAGKSIEELQDVDSKDFLKVLMIHQFGEGDYEKAAAIASVLIRYEHSTLASVTQEVHEISTKDLSDEELEARLKELEESPGPSSKLEDSGHAQENQENQEDQEDT